MTEPGSDHPIAITPNPNRVRVVLKAAAPLAGCGVDYAAATIESMALEAADPAAARACLEDALDDAVVREMAVAAILGVVEESPEVDEAIAAMTACTTTDEG